MFNRTLRFGEFSGTNDPQEYKSKSTGAIGWGWEDHHDQKIEEATLLIDKILREKSKFMSFCQNDIVADNLQSHGVLKSRMWAQLHISEHSDQSFRDYPITHFGLNRSLIP
ncbi:hypothetical protein, partial [Vibrio vulnificus]|uniref:hypothetical protein n=1 Tax=Vibrio vulnificus TaxID=672 RepID=UPI00128BA4C4